MSCDCHCHVLWVITMSCESLPCLVSHYHVSWVITMSCESLPCFIALVTTMSCDSHCHVLSHNSYFLPSSDLTDQMSCYVCDLFGFQWYVDTLCCWLPVGGQILGPLASYWLDNLLSPQRRFHTLVLHNKVAYPTIVTQSTIACKALIQVFDHDIAHRLSEWQQSLGLQ